MKIDLRDFIPQLQDPECIPNIDTLAPSFWRWSEALKQERWGLYVLPEENVLLNIMLVAHKLMLIQQYFPKNKLIPVSWYRSRKYNIEIKGALASAHIEGLACDVVIEGIKASDVRKRLASELETLNIRMERLKDTDDWVHFDLREPGLGGRYFEP